MNFTFFNQLTSSLNNIYPQSDYHNFISFLYGFLFPAGSSTLVFGVVLYLMLLVSYFYTYFFRIGTGEFLGSMSSGWGFAAFRLPYLQLAKAQFFALFFLILFIPAFGFLFVYLFVLVQTHSLLWLNKVRKRDGKERTWLKSILFISIPIISFFIICSVLVSSILYFRYSNFLGLHALIGFTLAIISILVRFPHWGRLYIRWDLSFSKGWLLLIISIVIGFLSGLFYILFPILS